MNADGSNIQLIYNTLTWTLSDLSWSPDGSKIAFTKSIITYGGISSDDYAFFEICVMDTDGSLPQHYTNYRSDGLCYDSTWSPDGKRIAFVCVKDGDAEIYIMKSNGTKIQQITDNDWGDVNPAWSPDGKQIAFVSYMDGDAEIYIMKSNGKDIRQITDNDWDDRDPEWSPDGTMIVFSAEKDKYNSDIFIMNTDGSNVQQLTFNTRDDKYPTWQP